MSLTLGLVCFECREKADLLENEEEIELLYDDMMFFFDDGISIELEAMLEWIERHKNHKENCIGFEII